MQNTLHLAETDDRSVQEELQFEYLKNWISSVHDREVADEVTCPFRSLAIGISHHFRLCREGPIRSTLVLTYRRLTAENFETLARQKLEDETSFFHMTLFKGVEEVRKYWNWYLYCLTFESGEDLPEGVVRVPLDYTDLKVLSQALTARITVSTLEARPRCFCPDAEQQVNIHVHLVHHKSRWAPVLGRKMAVKGLENQLVALQNLDGGPFQNFKHKGAVVLPNQTGEDREYYEVCIGTQILPMHRNQLQLVASPNVDTSENSSLPWWRRWQGPALGEAPSFRGIPDGSVEFQLLLQLLGDLVFKRLRQKREQEMGYQVDDDRTNRHVAYTSPLPRQWWSSTLAGPMAPAPAPAFAPAAAPVPQERKFETERRPLEEVIKAMQERRAQKLKCKIHLRSPTNFSREGADWANFMPLRRGMYLCLTGVVEHSKFIYLFKGFADQEERKSWLIPDLLCIWEVLRAMAIKRTRESTTCTVELQEGDILYLTDLYDEGWAAVRQWSTSEQKQGVVNLRHQGLRPILCIQKGDLGSSSSVAGSNGINSGGSVEV